MENILLVVQKFYYWLLSAIARLAPSLYNPWKAYQRYNECNGLWYNKIEEFVIWVPWPINVWGPHYPLQTNVPEILGGMFLSPPLALKSGPILLEPLNQKIKVKKRNIVISTRVWYWSTCNLRYKKCVTLPYDLYCPSVKVDDPEYVCAYAEKFATKALLKLHLRAAQAAPFTCSRWWWQRIK